MRYLSDHMFDIVENSITAGAKLIEVTLNESKIYDCCTLEIEDDGCGMTDEVKNRALDPFFTSRTTRRVGLGLPLLKQKAETAGGTLLLESTPGEGTKVTARFKLSHPDRPPIGDLSDSWVLLTVMNPKIKMIFSYITDSGAFEIDIDEYSDVKESGRFLKKKLREKLEVYIKDSIKHINAE